MASLKELMVKIGADTSGLDSGLDASLGKFNIFAGAIVSGGAAIVAGFTAIGVAAFRVGKDWEAATSTIRVGTGATGQALEDLKASAQNVFATVPGDAGMAATAIADLNTRTGQTGLGLEALAIQTLNLSRITGTDLQGAIAATTRVFGDWNIATKDQSAANDYLFKVSQSTGIGIDDLANKVVQFGAPMRGLGLSFEETAAMMGKWEKEGVNVETAMAGIRAAMPKLAEMEGGPVAGFKAVSQAIQDAGSMADAQEIAFAVFGQRAGADLADAIRGGKFEIDDLVASLNGSTETINAAADASLTLGDRWDILSNKVSLLLEPLGSVMVSALSDLVTWMTNTYNSIGDVVTGFQVWLDEMRALSPGLDALLMIVGAIGQAFTILVTNHIKMLIDGLGKLAEAASYVWDFFRVKGAAANKAVADSTKEAATETKDFAKWLRSLETGGSAAAEEVAGAGGAIGGLGSKAAKAKPELFNLDKALRDVEASNKALEKTAQDAAKALANDLANDAGVAELAVVSVATETQNAMLKIQGFTTTAADEWSALATAASMKTADIDAAFKALGLNTITQLNQMATDAETQFNLIKGSGEATPAAIETAWINMLQRRKDALVADGTDLSNEEQKTLDALLAKQKTFSDNSVGESGVFTTWASSVKGVMSGLSTDLVDALFPASGGFSLSNIGDALGGIADKFKNALAQPAKDALQDLIDNGISKLMGALDGVIAKLTGSNGVSAAFDAAFGGGASAGGAVAGGGGGSIPSGGGGGAGGGGGSGIGNAINIITGLATAISSIFGNFQMAAMNKTLDLIEKEVRFGTDYLGDRGDGGILGQMFRVAHALEFGVATYAVQESRDYLKSIDNNYLTNWHSRILKLDAIGDAVAPSLTAQQATATGIVDLRSELMRLAETLKQFIDRPIILEVDGQELARVVGANTEALRATA